MPPTKVFLAALAATCLLVACGDDDEADVDTQSTSVEQEGEEESEQESVSADDIVVEGEFGETAEITVPDGLEVPELVTEDVIEGDGAEVAPGATVTVHYSGVLLDGTEFDASFGGAPATFPLDGVIPGWTEGIPGMHVGGRRLLVIPSELAYGAAGSGPIPPDSPLVFVVDMLDAA